jgi:tetratricopeptide (TPR) repeat protein
MSQLKRFIVEIHRRSLWQVLTIYLVGSWIALQVADTVTAVLGLPDWVPSVALVLLIVLLPVVLATAFVQEGMGGPQPRRATPQTPSLPSVKAGRAEERPQLAPHGAHHRLFTWRNAIFMAVALVAVLGLSVTGYMGLRQAGIGPFGTLIAKGELEPQERVVLADFEDLADDPQLARTVTRAFRVDLTQSPVVNLVEPELVSDVLARMGREPAPELELELAREIAIREGLKAVIAGAVSRVGERYVLSVQVVAAESGDVLVAYRETARSSDEIIDAIDRLSDKLRASIGESFKTIRRNPPLHQVTTQSLEALRKYSQAHEAGYIEGDYERAIALLEEAIALDTAFAMAYDELADHLANRGEQRARRVEAVKKAYAHRDRLTEAERYKVTADYHIDVTGERDKAILAFRTLLDSRPEDVEALNDLALLYRFERQFERAEEMFHQVVALDSTEAIAYANLMHAQMAQGKYDEAEQVLAKMRERFPGHPWTASFAYNIFGSRGEYEVAEAHVRALREAQPTNLFVRSGASAFLATLARVRGRLDEAERHLRDQMATEEERGLPAEYLRAAAEVAWQELQLRRAPARALRILESALDRHPLDGLDPLDRPYAFLAAIYSVAREPDRAEALLYECDSVTDPDVRRGDEAWLHHAAGHLAMARGDRAAAVTEFRKLDSEIECPICALYGLGQAYDQAGVVDSAIAVFERYLTTPFRRVYWDSFALANIYERLGELYEARGDAEKAIYYYGKLVDLWKDADSVLQPRVAAARRAIEVLSPDT